MTDPIFEGVEAIDVQNERKLTPSQRVLGEVVQLHRIESSSLVNKDVKQLLSGIRARLVLLHVEMKEAEDCNPLPLVEDEITALKKLQAEVIEVDGDQSVEIWGFKAQYWNTLKSLFKRLMP